MPKKILVVDDERNMVRLLQVNLEREGYEVVTAFDGMEGLQKARTENPDLVLLDITMPRMDGFEFIDALRSMKGHTHRPIVAVSGLASSADHRRIKDAGFTGYIDKPFDAVRLLAAIDDAMAQRSS